MPSQESENKWVGYATVRGHATFRKWSSHHAWATFKVTLEEDELKRIVAVKVYTQAGINDGSSVRPRFRSAEWTRMKEHAVDIALRKSQGNVDVATDTRTAVLLEAPQEKPHQIALCEKCTELRFSCTGMVQDVNGRWYRCRLHALRRRRQRLDGSPRRTLYHQTSAEAAAAIVATQRMVRGSSGLCGGGIYFATTPQDTNHKAQQRGVILEVSVKLGRIKNVNGGDSRITFGSLLDEGFDSVRCMRPGGDEFIVYNSDQVVSISRLP